MPQDFVQKTVANKAAQTILWMLIGLPLLAVLVIAMFTGYSNERVLTNQARQLLVNRTNESEQYAREFLGDMQSQVRMSHSLFSNGLLGNDGLQDLENYYIAQLELYPVVAGLYSSNLNGDFFYVSRSIEKEKGPYRVKIIQRFEDEVITKVWWRGSASDRSFEEFMPDDGFDSRERPWFKEATHKKTMVWTNPYVFFTTKKLGVTIAAPFLNDDQTPTGAIGVDVELTELADFLQELDKTRFGSSFIVTHSGTFIAAPNINDEVMTSSGERTLLSVDKLEDERVKMAYETILSEETKEFSFAGEKYLVESTPLKLEQSVPWYIVSYAKKNDFLSQIIANNKRNYIIAGLVTLLTALLGWLFAKKLSRPVLDLEEQANKDQLTGLYNRNYLNKNIEFILDRAKASNQNICFAIIDLDYFKKINDSHGHAFGDQVLRIFSKRLTNQLRENDRLIRLGGEEFLLILPDTDAQSAYRLLTERSETLSSQPYHYDGQRAQVTFSAGLVQANFKKSASINFQDIYKAADQALYSAKTAGRSQVVIL